MPAPSGSLATLRPDLASSFLEFDLDVANRGFIAAQVAPVVESRKPSGTFGIVPVAQLMVPVNTKRAPGGGYSRGKFTFDDVAFSCEEHGFEEPVDDREALMYADYFSAETIAAARARDNVLKNYEERMAALIFNATTWAAATTNGSNWNATTGTPYTDVKAAIKAIRLASGLIADTAIMDYDLYLDVLATTQIVDRIKYQGFQDARPSRIPPSALAACLGLDRVLVAGCVKNSATEGQAFSGATAWDKTMCMVCKLCPDNGDPKAPGIARTIHWSEDSSQIGTLVETYRDEHVRSDIVRARFDVDELVVYVSAGHLLTGLNA